MHWAKHVPNYIWPHHWMASGAQP